MDLILLCLLVAIYFDTLLLKRRDRPLFGRVFAVPLLKGGAAFLFVLAVLYFLPLPQGHGSLRLI